MEASAVKGAIGSKADAAEPDAVRLESAGTDLLRPAGTDRLRPNTDDLPSKCVTDVLLLKSGLTETGVNDGIPSKTGVDGLCIPSKTGVDGLCIPSKTGVDGLCIPSKTGVDGLCIPSKTGVDGLCIPSKTGASKIGVNDGIRIPSKTGASKIGVNDGIRIPSKTSVNDGPPLKTGVADALLPKGGDYEYDPFPLLPGVTDVPLPKAVLPDTKSAWTRRSSLVHSAEVEKGPISPTLKRQGRDEHADEEKSASPPKKRCVQLDDEEKEEVVDIQVERMNRPPLPPRQVIGPDEHGIKRYIDYSDQGSTRVRTVTTTRVHKIATVVVTPRVAERRRTWAKFGDAVEDDMILRARTDGIVMMEIPVHKHEATVPPPSALSPTKAGAAARLEVLARGGSVKAAGAAAAVAEAEARGQKIYQEHTTGSSCFVIRIGDLPFDSREDNVRDLVEQFGQVKHVALARNPRTGASLRYAFVYFYNKADGEAAIEALADGLEAREVGMLSC